MNGFKQITDHSAILSRPDYVGPEKTYKTDLELEELKNATFREYYNICFHKGSHSEADSAEAEDAIREFYKIMNWGDVEFVWARSPFEIIKHFGNTKAAIDKFTTNYFSAQDGYWICDFIFMMRYEPGTPETRRLWETKVGPNNTPVAEIFLLWDRIIRSTSHWWPFDKYVFVTEKTKECNLRDDGMFHAIDKPAIQYQDLESIYIVANVVVPERIIMRPETITVQEIRKESNLEIKSIMMEKYGFKRYFADIGAKLLDRDSIPVGGGVDAVILRALLKDHDGNNYLLTQDGSTERVFCMNVDPAATTCKQAHFSISGIDDDEIKANA